MKKWMTAFAFLGLISAAYAEEETAQVVEEETAQVVNEEQVLSAATETTDDIASTTVAEEEKECTLQFLCNAEEPIASDDSEKKLTDELKLHAWPHKTLPA
ncbi:MAG: hypothetical protein SNF33_07690 [Candidatus Algichlamydia australiensis]|nr:hypothetical protein [Chlamydiales bacterium]